MFSWVAQKDLFFGELGLVLELWFFGSVFGGEMFILVYQKDPLF